jgi:hypothetical protein
MVASMPTPNDYGGGPEQLPELHVCVELQTFPQYPQLELSVLVS